MNVNQHGLRRRIRLLKAYIRVEKLKAPRTKAEIFLKRLKRLEKKNGHIKTKQKTRH